MWGSASTCVRPGRVPNISPSVSVSRVLTGSPLLTYLSTDFGLNSSTVYINGCVIFVGVRFASYSEITSDGFGLAFWPDLHRVSSINAWQCGFSLSNAAGYHLINKTNVEWKQKLHCQECPKENEHFLLSGVSRCCLLYTSPSPRDA